MNSAEYERIGGGGRLDVAGEGEVEGINYGGIGNNRCIVIVEGSVHLVVAREGIGGGEFSTRKNLPDNVKVL